MSNDTKGRILLVDKNRRNLELLSAFVGQLGYTGVPFDDPVMLREALEVDDRFDLALLDISGFDAGIWQICELLRTLKIRLLLISARQSQSLQTEGMKHGVSGILIKPLIMRELTGLINGMILNE